MLTLVGFLLSSQPVPFLGTVKDLATKGFNRCLQAHLTRF